MLSLKLVAGGASVALSGVSGVAVLLQTDAIPPEWVLGTLVTILIAVLTAFGAILKVVYDRTKKWDTVLSGAADVDGDSGFIGHSEDRHDELQQSHEKMYEQMRIQGQLLSEMAYSFADIAETLEQKDDVEVNVNIDRIERLHERKKEHTYDESDNTE